MKVIHSHLNITQVELLQSYFKMFSWVRFPDPMEIGWLLEVIVDFPYYKIYCCYCSVTKLSLTLPSHGLQQARLPCSLLSPRVCSNSCPLNWRCHPTISSYIVPFSCLQSFPTLESFPMSWLFTSGSQWIGISASVSVLPMTIRGWFPLRLTGLISIQPKGLSRILSNTTVLKHQFFGPQPWSNSHICT